MAIEIIDELTQKNGGNFPITRASKIAYSNTDSTVSIKDKIDTINSNISTHIDDTISHVNSSDKINWSDKYTKSEIENKISAVVTSLDYKEHVATFADLSTTYPSPQDGWTVSVDADNITYKYNGTIWFPVSANSIPMATESLDGKMSSVDKTKVNGISTNAKKVESSSINGNIKIDGTETNVYTHPSTHLPSIISQDANNRFVTDAEITTWNAKANQSDLNTTLDKIGVLSDLPTTDKTSLVNSIIETNEQLSHIVQVFASSFGAIGDNNTDNATAFQNLSSYVNTLTGKSKVEVIFPNGTLKYSNGLNFTKEVKLKGTLGSILNYVGTGKAISLGRDNVTNTDYFDNQNYEVDGITFTGGNTMTYGIYFNKHVTMPRVLNCKFFNFGNSSAWGIYFDDNNWDAFVHNCSWFNPPTGLTGLKWIGMSPFANTRVRISDCLASNLSGWGTAIYLNGYNCIVHNCKIEGFQTCIRLGGYSNYSKITNCYFESANNDVDGVHHGCIEIGSITGEVGENLWADNFAIENCYANLHNDGTKNEHFLATTKITQGLKYVSLKNIGVSSCGQEFIYQNDIGSQIGNRASGCYGYTLFHTQNTSEEWGDVNGGNETYKNNADKSAYFAIQSGKTATQYAGFKINDYDGSQLYSVRSNSIKNIEFLAGLVNYFTVTTNGVGYFHKTLYGDGAIGANILQLTARHAQDSAITVGTLFEDSADNKLKYKKFDGTVITIG